MTMEYYILQEHEPVMVDDLWGWARWFETADRTVAKTTIGDVRISTIFLGIDHRFDEGKPILFETLVFGGKYDEEMRRYSTWDEAEAGHAEMVQLVKGDK